MATDDVINPSDILVRVIEENLPRDIWKESAFIKYRIVGNTNRGEIGEEFIRRFLIAHKLKVERIGRRTDKTDMMIKDVAFEVKTASLGANGTFQFNHVRLDREYKYLLCVGICPEQIVFGMWRKGIVAEGGAGHLVRMAEGQAVTYKLTKKLSDDDLFGINKLPKSIREMSDRK